MTIKSKVTSGFKWTGISQVSRQTLQWITTAILARLLMPSDYGLMAMAIVILNFVVIFRGLGTASALVQRESITESLTSSIFWFNIVLGLTMTLVIFFLSPIIAYIYHEPMLTNILRVISLGFFINSFSIVQQAILERNLAFFRIVKIEIVATIFASIISIFAALNGLGVWSLVLKSMMEVFVVTSMICLIAKWRPKLIFNFAEVRSITSYSFNLTGFNILNFIARNADYILIGRILGAADLGYYTLAYRLMYFPLMNITNAISRVTFPAFSRMQDNIKMFQRAYKDLLRSIAFITFPMMLGLMVVSNIFVITILGSKWEPVYPLLIILAPVGMLQSVLGPVGGIYQSKGRTDWMFRWGIVSSSITVISFVIGIRWGILGVAISYAIAVALLAYPSFAIPLRLINLRVLDLPAVFWKPFLCSSVMMIVVYACKNALRIDISPQIYLTVLVFIGLITYSVLSWYINGNTTRKVLEIAGMIKAK